MLLKLLYVSGIRVSELCGLKWCDAVPRTDGGQITVFGKGGKTRTILLKPKSWAQLLSIRGDAGPVDAMFRSRKAADISTRLKSGESFTLPRRKRVLSKRSRPTGCATLTPATRWTGALPFTWYRRLSATPQFRPQAVTCTRDRPIAPVFICPSSCFLAQVVMRKRAELQWT